MLIWISYGSIAAAESILAHVQVPLIGWMGGWKFAQNAVGGIAPGFTGLLFRRTGRQFFLKDSDSSVALAAAASALQSHQLDEGAADPAAAAISAVADAPSVSEEDTPVTWGGLGDVSVGSGHAESGGGAKNARASVNSGDAAAGSNADTDADADSVTQPVVPHVVSHNISFLLQLAFDIEGGPQFISALGAFASRTAYSNADSDHLVGWANSSLRSNDELPQLDAHTPDIRVKGVANEDAIGAAFEFARGGATERGHADPSDAATILHVDVAEASSGSDAERAAAAPASTADVPRAMQQQQQSLQHVIHASRAERVRAMLQNLNTVPWARVDCSWRGAGVSTFAHNHIQVTRGWLNMVVRCTTGLSMHTHCALAAPGHQWWHRSHVGLLVCASVPRSLLCDPKGFAKTALSYTLTCRERAFVST